MYIYINIYGSLNISKFLLFNIYILYIIIYPVLFYSCVTFHQYLFNYFPIDWHLDWFKILGDTQKFSNKHPYIHRSLYSITFIFERKILGLRVFIF